MINRDLLFLVPNSSFLDGAEVVQCLPYFYNYTQIIFTSNCINYTTIGISSAKRVHIRNEKAPTDLNIFNGAGCFDDK